MMNINPFRGLGLFGIYVYISFSTKNSVRTTSYHAIILAHQKSASHIRRAAC